MLKYIDKYIIDKIMRKKKEVLTEKSKQKIDTFINSILEIIDDNFIKQFYETISFDVKNIKDCKETSIVDYYLDSCEDLLTSEANIESKLFWDKLKRVTRQKLLLEYMPNKSFDNNIDIYFNDVKREYILHPMNESESLEFIPENREIFIKNNLKLVIDCAKRYQGLGMPFDDLIQTGNLGLLIAWEKFDTERASLRQKIIDCIFNFEKENFTKHDASNIIKENFKYTKLLDATLMKVPEDGFLSKEEFHEWVLKNIKKASFSSIGFAWIRATITSALSKSVNIVHVPKTALDKGINKANIIRLDSINPHTDDNYNDNVMAEYYNSDEFLFEDTNLERQERNNTFKYILKDIFLQLEPIDVRIIKQKFGIEYPFELSIQEISEREGLSVAKVKNSINNTLEFINNNINEHDRNTLIELLK